MAARGATAVRAGHRGGRLRQEPPGRDGGPPPERARCRDGTSVAPRSCSRGLDRTVARTTAARSALSCRAAAALAEAGKQTSRKYAHGTADRARLRRHRRGAGRRDRRDRAARGGCRAALRPHGRGGHGDARGTVAGAGLHPPAGEPAHRTCGLERGRRRGLSRAGDCPRGRRS